MTGSITESPTMSVVGADADSITIHIPMTFRQRCGRKEVVLPGDLAPEHSVESDAKCPLKVALARAFHWQKMIESGEVDSNVQLARKFNLDQSYVARTIRLASLAPDIVESILRGNEPDRLSLKSMRRDLPLSWEEQRSMIGLNNVENQ